MAGDLTSGFDYGSGLNGLCGTPTPSGAVVIQTATGNTPVTIPLEEDPDSPEIEFGEQATLTHRYTCSWSEAATRIFFLGRGTLLADSNGLVTKILSSKIQRQPGGRATLVVVSEGVNFETPPDRFEITPVELGLNILKHPRYFYALLGDGEGTTSYYLNQQVIRFLQNYFENPTAQYRQWLEGNLFYSFGHAGTLIGGSTAVDPASLAPFTPSGQSKEVYPIAGTDMAKAAAQEIIEKYWKGEETPYVIGYQIIHTIFYFRPVYLNPGGYIEDPFLQAVPQIPLYFTSVDFPPSAAHLITDQMAAINPQCYSSTGLSDGAVNISWMRKADQMEEERTWFKLSRTWIGSAVGYWDPDIYSAQRRPQDVNDYNFAHSSPILIDKQAGWEQL